MTELRQRAVHKDAPLDDKESESEANLDGETASDSQS